MRRTLAAAAIVLAALAVPMEGARGPAVAFPRRSPPPVVVPSAAPASTPPLAAGTCVELAVPSPETDTVVSSRAVMALPPLRRAFVEQAARTARWVQRRTGIPASAGIAQAIWESGWGTNDLAAVYNLHAMKTFGRCDGRDTSPMGPLDVPWTSTREPRRGLEQCPYFRQYGSAEQGWLDWALRFYRRVHTRVEPDYAVWRALRRKRHVRDFLQAGALWSYNADAEYTTRVMRQVELLELWRYDVPQKEWKLLCALRELAPLVAPRAVRE